MFHSNCPPTVYCIHIFIKQTSQWNKATLKSNQIPQTPRFQSTLPNIPKISRGDGSQFFRKLVGCCAGNSWPWRHINFRAKSVGRALLLKVASEERVWTVDCIFFWSINSIFLRMPLEGRCCSGQNIKHPHHNPSLLKSQAKTSCAWAFYAIRIDVIEAKENQDIFTWSILIKWEGWKPRSCLVDWIRWTVWQAHSIVSISMQKSCLDTRGNR